MRATVISIWICFAGLAFAGPDQQEQPAKSESREKPAPSPSSRRVVRSSKKPIKINMPKLRNAPKFKKPKSM